MEKSVSHALSFGFLAPVVSRFWHKMKGSGLPLCILVAVFYLSWTPSAGLKTLHLGSCVVITNLQEMHNGFSEIRDTVVREEGTPHNLVAASPLLYLSFSVLQQCDYKKRQAGDSLPERCQEICSS